jgi:O-antigen/teichoic acid export membrane protein
LRRLFARLGLHHAEHVSIARDFSVYSAVNVVSLVLLLGTALILRRYLGAVQAGIWITLELLPKYAQYAPLGVLNSAERDLPYLLGARRADEFERRKHTLVWLLNGIGAVLMIAGFAGALIVRSRTSSPELVAGLVAYAPILWLQILAAFYVVLYRARKRFVVLSTRQGIANFLKAALTMAGGYAFGLYGVFGALLAASAIQVALFHSGLDERFERFFDAALVRPMLIDGLPMLLGAVAFETIRNADVIVIPSALGFAAAGVYSVTPIVCQGVFYFPNTLSLVMFPRFQERYGETQDAGSLQRFIEMPLRVLGDALLAGIIGLMVALPPIIMAVLPDYAGSIAPLPIMLVATYFLCLSPPAGQFLLTIHKQVPALFIALPAMALALAGAYVGAARGLVALAEGIAFASLVYCVTVNLYAYAMLGLLKDGVRLLTIIGAKAVVGLGLAWAIVRFVPEGPPPFSLIGGWRLVAAAAVAAPLLVSAIRHMRTLSRTSSTGQNQAISVDKRVIGH